MNVGSVRYKNYSSLLDLLTYIIILLNKWFNRFTLTSHKAGNDYRRHSFPRYLWRGWTSAWLMDRAVTPISKQIKTEAQEKPRRQVGLFPQISWLSGGLGRWSINFGLSKQTYNALILTLRSYSMLTTYFVHCTLVTSSFTLGNLRTCFTDRAAAGDLW